MVEANSLTAAGRAKPDFQSYNAGDHVAYRLGNIESFGLVLDIDKFYDHQAQRSLRRPYAFIRCLGGEEISVNTSDSKLRHIPR